MKYILIQDFDHFQDSYLNWVLSDLWMKLFLFHPAEHKGSHWEVYQEFQPSYDSLGMWCQGLFRPRVPCTQSLHGPIADSASTQSQQQV